MTRKISLYAVITALTVAVSNGLYYYPRPSNKWLLLHWRMQGIYIASLLFWSDRWLDSRSF